jgi:sirohydrochlorin cobaltochelatase
MISRQIPILTGVWLALSGMAHEMDAASLKVLRERVPSYAEATDAYINESMGRMAPDYFWTPGEELVRGDVGILVLAHGARAAGDQVMKDGVTPIAAHYPVAAAFGMAMMGSGHIQAAANRLTDAGAKTIVVVPVVVTKYASLYRQWDYILGNRSEGAYLDVPQIKTAAKVIIAPAIADHRLMTELLLDHARELSTNPAAETVILVGHGPANAEENAADTAIMAVHAERLKQQGGFAGTAALNLQDDAPDPIRAANVARLRALVEAANKSGRTPLVVGYLMATRGIQEKIQHDLAGLTYKFQPKGITSHPNFTAWVRETVADKATGM